jgi:protein-L-isoaspartate(D-aspartate) O-methyltransferase
MLEMNVDSARHNMVECQIRTWEVLDRRILDLVARAPRHEFVPAAYRKLAFADMQLPLAHGQAMMAPKVEARLLQALDIRANDKILEIGTGSGYVTWLLAQLGRSVDSIEIFADLSATAKQKLAAHNVTNALLEVGDAAAGWERRQPYDVIFVTGSLPILPESFKTSLAPGGRLAIIVGQSPAMEAKLIQRMDTHGFTETALFETDLPALVNAKQPERFVF